MKFFILFNLLLFCGSILLTFKALMNFQLFLTLPLSLEILILIGLVTPIMNLYDTIRNFVMLSVTNEDSGEDED